MPGELLGWIRVPCEASIIMNPPEQYRDDDSQARDSQQRHKSRQLDCATFAHRYSVAWHCQGSIVSVTYCKVSQVKSHSGKIEADQSCQCKECNTEIITCVLYPYFFTQLRMEIFSHGILKYFCVTVTDNMWLHKPFEMSNSLIVFHHSNLNIVLVLLKKCSWGEITDINGR